jgi:hypothetical protein
MIPNAVPPGDAVWRRWQNVAPMISMNTGQRRSPERRRRALSGNRAMATGSSSAALVWDRARHARDGEDDNETIALR